MAILRNRSMTRSLSRHLIVLGIACLAVGEASHRKARADEGGEFFEQQVRPLLVAKCVGCHGDKEPEAGLRLTSQAHLLKGGSSGPAVVLKMPKESRLIQAVSRTGPLKMPPDETLSAAEVAVLSKWIELGLPWPKSVGVTSTQKEFSITESDRSLRRRLSTAPLSIGRFGP